MPHLTPSEISEHAIFSIFTRGTSDLVYCDSCVWSILGSDIRFKFLVNNVPKVICKRCFMTTLENTY